MVVWCTTQAAEEYVSLLLLLLFLLLPLLLLCHNWLRTNPGQLATSQARIGKQERTFHWEKQVRAKSRPSSLSAGREPTVGFARQTATSTVGALLLLLLSHSSSPPPVAAAAAAAAAALAGLGRTIRAAFGADNSNRGQQTRPGKPGLSSLSLSALSSCFSQREIERESWRELEL